MRRPGAILATASALVLLAGCQPQPAPPSPTPSVTTPAHVFTVMTTEAPGTYDPAAAQTGADATVALDVFQRLMVVHPEKDELKPDAATDCLFTSPTVYECQLQKGLSFSNGHPVTAADVKFSIERAYRLNVARTSIKMFDSLQKVEAIDDQTVRFTLKWPDNQFGQALATPAASIVDHSVYDPDNVAAPTAAPVGSGPFTVVADPQGLTFTRNPTYVGATGGSLEKIRMAFAADSAAVEQAMTDGTADVVWRSLDAGALGRISSGATKTTMRSLGLPDTRLQRLIWNPASTNRLRADVRGAVASALQADRTLASLIPPKLAGSVASFPVGGKPTAAPIAGARLKLTLGYSSKAPGLADLARTLRDRLENNAGVSVQLRADAPDADLWITDAGAWVNTPLGWLQAYLDEPLPGTEAKLAQLTQNVRQMSDPTARQAVLAEIQQQAAADLTVLPLALQQETFYVSPNVKINGDPYGPGWQLGLWGFGK